MTEKSGNRGFSDIESQILAIEIDKLRSAIEKMTVSDTVLVSQSDQLKYQVASLAEAMSEIEVRLKHLEQDNLLPWLIAIQIVGVAAIFTILWFTGVWK